VRGASDLVREAFSWWGGLKNIWVACQRICVMPRRRAVCRFALVDFVARFETGSIPRSGIGLADTVRLYEMREGRMPRPRHGGDGSKASFNPAYVGSRPDILRLIPATVTRLLDVGCATGELGLSLKRRRNSIEVVGVELNASMALAASAKLDRVINADIGQLDLGNYVVPGYFDCIVFGDILEHLSNPWHVVRESVRYLSVQGLVIASIPNIRHYSTVFNLIFKGYWPYRDRGIHDRTHLRFFALRNVLELFEHAGLSIFELKRKYRLVERPHRLNRFAKYFAVPFVKEFLVFQYVVLARKLGQQGEGKC